MAADDGGGGEGTRSRFLAILRYIVATVVIVLAVVVIAKVVAVGARPEEIRVSVIRGHVGTTALWKEVAVSTPRVRRGELGGRGRGCATDAGDEPTGIACPYVGGGGVLGRPYGIYDRPPTRTTYSPVERLDLQFVLSVHNPSGRGAVNCSNVMVVSFIDEDDDDDTGGPMIISNITLPYGFLVRRQSSHKFARTAHVVNTTVLAHIASSYGGSTSFTGKMKVTMSTSHTRLGKSGADPRNVSFEC